MANISETSISPEVASGIRKCARNAIRILKVEPRARPSVILEAIDEFAWQWQKGNRPDVSVLDDEDAPFTLGSLWGEIIVARFKWEWVRVTFHDHGDSVAHGVVSPDRALAIYPIHFLMGCLANPGVDVTIMLAYNMMKAGSFNSPAEPPAGEYFNLMDGVHRIIPRG